MRTVLIEVTTRDIALARPGTPDACPLALALRRQGFPSAMVDWNRWYPKGYPKKVWTTKGSAMLTDEARSFVNAFDNHRVVKPHRFRLPRLQRVAAALAGQWGSA